MPPPALAVEAGRIKQELAGRGTVNGRDMIDKHEALEAEERLVGKATEKSLERVGREITRFAAAKGTLLSGGTVRKLVRTLVEQLESAANTLIVAHVKAGTFDAKEIATRVLSTLDPISNAFLESHAKRSAGALQAGFESLRPEVKQFFDSLADRATIALTEYPRATEQIIAELIPERLPSGWNRVDRALQKARTQLSRAREEEDFQTVGLLCREVLISTAQAVYEPNRHPPLDDELPSETDVKRQLDSYFAAELTGNSNEPMRKHARSALDLANTLQHKRTATFRLASLSLEATSSVVSVVMIVFGTREAKG